MNSDRRSFFLSAAAFLGLLLVFFFPVAFQGKVLAPLDILDHLMRPWSDGAGGFGVHNAMVYDAISQYLPYDWAVCQSLKQDGFIGWNPYVYGGYALLENTMLCPGDWHHQLYRFFDFWTAWDLGIVLQFAIAGMGMVLMLCAEKATPAAALLGAVCYAFYSQHTTWLYHRWVLGASCWFPWMVWAIRKARAKRRQFDLASAAFTALALRGGSLQTCLFVVLLCMALFFAEAWENRNLGTGKIRGDGVQDRLARENGAEKTRMSAGAWRSGFLAFWTVLAATSTLLSMDVLCDTVPACLEGMRMIGDTTFLQCLKRIPHFGTLLLPSVFGSPQTMDAGKAFGADLFVTKFLGVAAIVLAVAGLTRKNSPLPAKLCIGLALVVTLTPLVKWFYERSTVVFAFGAAWLAAWALDNVPSVISARAWRRIAVIGAMAVAVWTLAGVVTVVLSPRILPAVHKFVEGSMQAEKQSRHDWMLARADEFVERFPPWSANNAIPVLLAAAGLFSVWKLSRQPRWKHARSFWSAAVVLCTFGELFVWSRTWITFSGKPETETTQTLYPVPGWAEQLRTEMSDGGLLWVHGGRPDFDYLQLNAQTGIDIASLQGYETIRPSTLVRPNAGTYDPDGFADRGVSHVLVLPGSKPPPGVSNWIDRIDTPDLHLFRNPAFDSRWHARLADGSILPLRENANSPNRHEFDLPTGTVAVALAEPFHRDWTDRFDGAEPVCRATKTETGGTLVSWDRPLVHPVRLIRLFRPRHPVRWLQLGILALGALGSFVCFVSGRARR